MRRLVAVLVVSAAVVGCGKPSAMSVCEKLASAGIASNCRAGTPGGLGAAAVEQAEYDLPSVAGKTGQVLRFDDASKYDATIESYSKLGGLAGPHRYGSRAKLIFVQFNVGASPDVGSKAKVIVDGL